MQVPAGDRFKYQYQLTLNGKDDTIEIWRNDPTTAQVIDFTPLFHDDSETKLFSTPYQSGSGNTTVTLARSLTASSDHTGAIHPERAGPPQDSRQGSRSYNGPEPGQNSRRHDQPAGFPAVVPLTSSRAAGAILPTPAHLRKSAP